MTVADPAYRQAVTSTLAALPHDKVLSGVTYWTTHSPQFAGAGGHETYAVLRLAGRDDAAQIKAYEAISGKLGAPGLTEVTGGQIPTEQAINNQVKSDIGRAEGLSMPVLLILMLVIFGSLAAASLPLAIGGAAILGSFAALRLLTLVTDVSVYSINITTILGLGLAIDYGLFMVARFRDELHAQPTTQAALARTVATAGRTVAVSGITVALALASLMLFPEMFLRSMGYGGVATVLVDMLAALTIMPALLAVLGPRVNALRIRRSVRRAPTTDSAGAWYRIARSVMRRPVAYIAVIVIALLALGSPFRSITWGGTDARALPAGSRMALLAGAVACMLIESHSSSVVVTVTAPVLVESEVPPELYHVILMVQSLVAPPLLARIHMLAKVSNPGVTGMPLVPVGLCAPKFPEPLAVIFSMPVPATGAGSELLACCATLLASPTQLSVPLSNVKGFAVVVASQPGTISFKLRSST